MFHGLGDDLKLLIVGMGTRIQWFCLYGMDLSYPSAAPAETASVLKKVGKLKANRQHACV